MRLDELAEEEACMRLGARQRREGIYLIDSFPGWYYKRLAEVCPINIFDEDEAERRLELYEELKSADFYHPETLFSVYDVDDGKYSVHCLMPELDTSEPERVLREREKIIEKLDICRVILNSFDKKMSTDVGIENWGYDGNKPYFIDMEIVSYSRSNT